MKNHVTILSCKAAARLIGNGFPKNTAVISFSDPPDRRLADYRPLDYKGTANRIFQIVIYDIDIEVLDEFGLTYDTYFPEASELALFIKKAVADGLDIICQCEYGQSRSAACAAAIREYYNHDGIKVFADYRYYPNQVIYNKLYDVLTATSSI